MAFGQTNTGFQAGNNMFSTGFNSSFSGGLVGIQTSGNNTLVKTQKKDDDTYNPRYPGFNEEQYKAIERLAIEKGFTGEAKYDTMDQLYKLYSPQILNKNKLRERQQELNNSIYQNSQSILDGNKEAKMGTDLTTLAQEMKKKYNIPYNIPDEEVIEDIRTMVEDGNKLLYEYTQNGNPEIFYAAGIWDKPQEEEKNQSSRGDTALKIGLGAGGLGALDAGLYGAGATTQRLGKKIYDFPIDSSAQEARQIQRAGVGVKDAEVAVKDAKADLKNAKKTGEGIEEAEKALEKAEADLKTAKGKKVVKVADSAREYNVGGGIVEGWTAESRGVQARSKANQIFKKIINPALENSKETINVQELIESLGEDIAELSKNDPDKLAAYGDALEDLKASYSDPKFANYSMKDSQTLKSGIQGRTPQKFFKGKEITNELQELKGILSSKLKNAIHSVLTREIGEDSAKLYLDYANLTKYADDMAKASTNAGLRAGFGNFWSTVGHKVIDGASAKAGLVLDKVGGTVKNVTSPKKRVERGSKALEGVRPSTWLNSLKGTLVKAGANPKTVNTAIKTLSKSEKVLGVATPKILGKLLNLAGEVALPLDAMGSANFIEDHIDMYSMIPMMYEKKNWKAGNPSKDFKGWTEDDWASIGLSEEDIGDILNSKDFKEVDNKTSWGGNRLYNEFIGLSNMSPIKELG